MSFVDKYIKGDRVIWLVAILLALLSILSVYSASGSLAYKHQGGNTFYYLFKHGIMLFVGLGLMLFAEKMDYKYYSRISQLALILAVPLLLVTLIMGVNIGNASRWLVIPGINQTFQTSDFAKLALIMYLARLLYKKQDNIQDFKSAFLPIMVPVLLVCGLILPANFSTAAILFTTCLIIMFIGRVNIKYILSLIGIGLGSLMLMLLIAKAKPELLPRLDTWVSRIESFSDGSSEGNYQAEQAKIAIAIGGPFGKVMTGKGNSTQRNFLPQSSSDFIYAIIIEEYGLIGGMLVIILYLILFYRGIKIAQKSEKTFGTFLAVGLSFSLVFQAMINMAVAVNLFPVTGQPLPLVSMGGTSIWFTCLAIGIILSVSRKAEKSIKQKKVNVAV
ncbi:MAG: FtsW/RodA/SpoVE family cell cycle protein [Flavobacteriales bacterium]|nr:FtsW/RodA/SpoVE family cell cycle protein [Flavobacteriales bacterium]